jgi:hypothetical protein
MARFSGILLSCKFPLVMTVLNSVLHLHLVFATNQQFRHDSCYNIAGSVHQLIDLILTAGKLLTTLGNLSTVWPCHMMKIVFLQAVLIPPYAFLTGLLVPPPGFIQGYCSARLRLEFSFFFQSPLS